MLNIKQIIFKGIEGKRSKILILLTSIISLILTSQSVNADPTMKEVLQKLKSMEMEIKDLKSELRQKKDTQKDFETVNHDKTVNTKETGNETIITNKESIENNLPKLTTNETKSSLLSTKSLSEDFNQGLFGLTYRSTESLKFGAYGEVKYGRQETQNGWRKGFDATRFVLLGTYPISDTIAFNAELEVEHGGIAKDADDKLSGAVELEQVFIDFRVNDYFNWRAPGVDVVPFGYVNLFHEPTQFYSVNRPELYQGLIPSTWYTGATSIYGKVVDNLTYQFQLNSGVEDSGTLTDEGDSVVPSGGYDPGISGTDAFGLARPSISDRKQLSNSLGSVLRLGYTPPFIRGLSGSTSILYTNNSSPKGAYGTNYNNSNSSVGVFPLGKSNLTMVDTEVRYRIPETGLELKGEYVQAFFGNPENLRANNDADFTNNVGKDMYGYSFETAYHFDLSSKIKNGWEVVPFYRYTHQNLQTSGFKGIDLNQSNGSGKQDFHTFGFALFPTPKVVLKFDYQISQNDSPDSPNNDHFLGSVGYFF